MPGKLIFCLFIGALATLLVAVVVNAGDRRDDEGVRYGKATRSERIR